MKYQLVLQWPGDSMERYDAMIGVESVLIAELSPESIVDGHDEGADQVNIFIHTDQPEHTFDEVKAILVRCQRWEDVKIAYRELSGNTYTILRPKNLTEFSVA